MTWALVIGAGWLLLATLTAVMIGRSVSLADARDAAEAVHDDEPNVAVDPPSAPAGTVLPFPAPTGDAPRASAPRSPVGPSTVPGIPVARPQAPGARGTGGSAKQIPRTGLG